ncbi:MAG: hypothetical protein FWC76_00105 [Defluviitaleaceae bacterium]|nr:hypothetical protein [Defluviitaleaceae bacterium]
MTHDDLTIENKAGHLQTLVLKLDRQARWLKRALIAVSIIVLLGGWYMFRTNHYYIALAINGLTETHRFGDDGTVNFGGRFLGEGNTVRFIFSQRGDDMGEFARLRQNSWGWWSVDPILNWRIDSGGILVTERIFISPNYFEDEWVARFNSWSWAAYYHNVNATALIELDHSLLPDYVTATLYQKGRSYVIQLDNIAIFQYYEIEEMINNLVRDFIE